MASPRTTSTAATVIAREDGRPNSRSPRFKSRTSRIWFQEHHTCVYDLDANLRMSAVPNQRERPTVPQREIGLADLQLLEEQTEAGDYEAESHERQTRSNPGEKSSFRGKIVSERAAE